MSRQTSFTSAGGLLPAYLLERVASGDSKLPGIAPTDYGLVPGERLNDAITRSWNRLNAIWGSFTGALEALPESDLTGTALTRERWLKPLLDELGFNGLPVAKAATIEGKSYAISHEWGESVPVHLPGARISIDRRTPGVPGASSTSPHGLLQEYLNRSDEHLWGIVSNGLVLRILRDNASMTRQAYLEFDLEAMFSGDEFSDFVTLWLVAHRTRFEGQPPEKCLLEQWSAEAVDQGTRALDKLRLGVEKAIESLGEGFIDHPANLELREALRSGELDKTSYQHQLLRTIYRMLFLLVAESRDLLLDPSATETQRARYRQFYSIDRVRQLSTKRRGTSHSDVWQSLTVTMSALASEGIPALGVAPLGSFLWSKGAVADLTDARIKNRHVLDAVRSLCTYQGDGGIDVVVDYANLGAEELGSIYESLLELHPEVDVNGPTFHLATASGNERKTTGSYYTPTSLITELLDSALDPVLDEAARAADPEAALLAVSVLDPACGSGHFLIAAANRIAQRLASVRAGGIEPAPSDVITALRDVVGLCIHGIDINPMAVELCKVSLWLEAMEPGRPLSFLDHRIVCGNALLGTTPRLLSEGLPDDAFKPLVGDEKAVVSALRKQNTKERKGLQQLPFGPSVAELANPMAVGIAEIDALPDDSVEQIAEKERRLAELSQSVEAQNAKTAADAWCSAFVAPKAAGEPTVTTDTVRRFIDQPDRVEADVRIRVEQLAAEYKFLHLHLAFPDVVSAPEEFTGASNQSTGWTGGFSAVLGNPPWERVKLQEKEWFAERDPEIASAPNAAARKRRIQSLREDDPQLFAAFGAAQRRAEGASHLLRNSGKYPLCGRGDVNTYTVFAELMRDAMAPVGRTGVIVPSGIATDDTTKFFFQDLVERRNLASLFDFENRNAIFVGVHRSYKFCLLTLSGDDRPVEQAEFVFFALETPDLNDPDRRFTLTPEDFELLNPNTRTCPIFRTRRDAEITKGIYRRVPVLVKEGPPEENPWGVKFLRMFDMSNDSHLFRTREQLEAEGWELKGNIFVRGHDRYLPLYEGRMGHQFNSRFATQPAGENQPISDEGREDPAVLPMPEYWLSEEDLRAASKRLRRGQALMGFRRVARNNDERTTIAAMLPHVPVSYGFILVVGPSEASLMFLMACFNSFVFDFCARSALSQPSFPQGTFAQLPCFRPTSDEAEELLPLVRELYRSSWDQCRADELPYRFSIQRREVLRAQLDAWFLRRYGLSRAEADHVLESFPIVEEHDLKEHGEFRTKRLILEIYDRMAEAEAAGEEYQTLLNPPPADPSLQHDPSTRPDWADLYLELAKGSK